MYGLVRCQSTSKWYGSFANWCWGPLVRTDNEIKPTIHNISAENKSLIRTTIFFLAPRVYQPLSYIGWELLAKNHAE